MKRVLILICFFALASLRTNIDVDLIMQGMNQGLPYFSIEYSIMNIEYTYLYAIHLVMLLAVMPIYIAFDAVHLYKKAKNQDKL